MRIFLVLRNRAVPQPSWTKEAEDTRCQRSKYRHDTTVDEKGQVGAGLLGKEIV